MSFEIDTSDPYICSHSWGLAIDLYHGLYGIYHTGINFDLYLSIKDRQEMMVKLIKYFKTNKIYLEEFRVEQNEEEEGIRKFKKVDPSFLPSILKDLNN